MFLSRTLIISCIISLPFSAVASIKLGPALQCRLGYIDSNLAFQPIPKSKKTVESEPATEQQTEINSESSTQLSIDEIILKTFEDQFEDNSKADKLQCFTDNGLVKRELLYNISTPSKTNPYHRYEFTVSMAPLDFFPKQTKDQEKNNIFPSSKLANITANLKYFHDRKADQLNRSHVLQANSDPTIPLQDRVIEPMKPENFVALEQLKSGVIPWTTASLIAEFGTKTQSLTFFKSVRGGFALNEKKSVLYQFLDVDVPVTVNQIQTKETIHWALSCEVVFKEECYKRGITSKDNVQAIQDLMFHVK